MTNALIERGTCPACGSGDVDRYVYGLPVPALMDQAIEADWLHLQGCVTFGNEPRMTCRGCGHREPPLVTTSPDSDEQDSRSGES